MNATLTKVGTVTPVKHRRRGRNQLRGPIAHPQRVVSPGGRPVGVPAPTGVGLPLEGFPKPHRGGGVHAAQGGVRLTDRGIAVVVALLAAIALAAVVIGVSQFLSISNAPIQDDAPSGAVVSSQRA